MHSVLKIFTKTKLSKAEKARKESIAKGDMIATRDLTDAIRYQGRGLKTWEGRKQSWNATELKKLGFKKKRV